MKKTKTLIVSVPEDAENPLDLVVESLERFAGRTYPVLDSRYIDENEMSPVYLAGAIIVEEVHS